MLGVRTRTSAAKLPTPLNDSESKAEEKTLIRDKTDFDCDYASIQVYMLGPDDELFEGTRLLVTNNGPWKKGLMFVVSVDMCLQMESLRHIIDLMQLQEKIFVHMW